MADHTPLEVILDNTQVPHQPLLIITDSAVFSGLPVFREALRRALDRSGPVLLVTAQHDPSYLLSGDNGSAANLTTINLTSNIQGFSDGPEASAESLATPGSALDRISAAYTPTTQVFIDALDLISEDTSPLLATRTIRILLDRAKPPSRVVLLLPRSCGLLDSLIPPSFSPALTLLHPLHPSLVSHLSKAYLQPISPDPGFWMILEKAKERRLPEQMAYEGSEGVEVCGDWVAECGAGSRGIGGSKRQGALVQVLVRKPTGGVKGITRTLAALVPSSSTSPGFNPSETRTRGPPLECRPIEDIVDVRPFSAPAPAPMQGTRHTPTGPPKDHGDMNLPFNLSLTDEQKRRRGQVPLPYAHEGEGAGDVDGGGLMEYGDEDDEDDEEI